jgi:hypothetical protein
MLDATSSSRDAINRVSTEDPSIINPNRKPNLNMDIVNEIAGKLGLTFTGEKDAKSYSKDAMNRVSTKKSSIENPKSFSPIDLLDYIYAVLHSPTYRETYKEFLKIDFPRIPYPSITTFWQLVKLGGELRQIHLLESDVVNTYTTSYPVDGDNVVGKIKFQIPPASGEGVGEQSERVEKKGGLEPESLSSENLKRNPLSQRGTKGDFPDNANRIKLVKSFGNS